MIFCLFGVLLRNWPQLLAKNLACVWNMLYLGTSSKIKVKFKTLTEKHDRMSWPITIEGIFSSFTMTNQI